MGGWQVPQLFDVLLWLREQDGLQTVRRVRSTTYVKYSYLFGLKKIILEYAKVGYSRPIMCREFVCDKGVKNSECYGNQRIFYNVRSEREIV